MALTRGLPRAQLDAAAASCAGAPDCAALPAAGPAPASGPGSGSGAGAAVATATPAGGSKSGGGQSGAQPTALTLQQVHVHAAGCVGSLVPGARPQLACALFDPVLFDTDALTQVLCPRSTSTVLSE